MTHDHTYTDQYQSQSYFKRKTPLHLLLLTLLLSRQFAYQIASGLSRTLLGFTLRCSRTLFEIRAALLIQTLWS
jgi:hypothetical protein